MLFPTKAEDAACAFCGLACQFLINNKVWYLEICLVCQGPSPKFQIPSSKIQDPRKIHVEMRTNRPSPHVPRPHSYFKLVLVCSVNDSTCLFRINPAVIFNFEDIHIQVFITVL